jgi:nitrogen fixation/metabolism regulation signal transduction histidine kinase
MASNRFTLGIVIRVLLIFGALLIITTHWDPDRHFFTLLVGGIVVTVMLGELIHYLNKINRELVRFLETIKDKGLTSRSLSVEDLSFRRLNLSFNQVMDAIQEANVEKEGQHQLLDVVVRQARTGIMLIEKDGKIRIMNPAARNILGLTGSISHLNALEKQRPELYDILRAGVTAQQLTLALHKEKGLDTHLSLTRSEIKIINQPYDLITFQDISHEIETTEVQSWQKLIRTLSHEMMNSTTPISSLAETSLQLIGDDEHFPESEKTRKLKRALEAIEKRSTGLYDFVDRVRELVKIPMPRKEAMDVKKLFEEISSFMGQELEKAGIRLETDVRPAGLTLQADPRQVEQVLINLLLNARDAINQTPDPFIRLQAGKDNSLTFMQVEDNGRGLDRATREKIFIPFYSTREGGSGIGLSLCRQIMQQHGGKLTVNSRLGKGSIFTLWFPDSRTAPAKE